MLADKLTGELCTNIKDKDIHIYAVTFDVTLSTVKNLLQACASDSSSYFDASDTAQLKLAFKKIARQLARLRISQ